MRAIPLPDPPLRDERVVLRPWQDDDVLALAAWARDPEVVRWTAIAPGYDEQHARAFRTHAHRSRLAGTAIYLAIAAPRTGIAIGSCDLRRPIADDPAVGEVGYLLGPEGRGHGCATSAVALLCHFAFATLGMARVQALVHPENVRSLHVLARAGFRREGVLRDLRDGAGTREDRMILSVLPGEVG